MIKKHFTPTASPLSPRGYAILAIEQWELIKTGTDKRHAYAEVVANNWIDSNTTSGYPCFICDLMEEVHGYKEMCTGCMNADIWGSGRKCYQQGTSYSEYAENRNKDLEALLAENVLHDLRRFKDDLTYKIVDGFVLAHDHNLLDNENVIRSMGA